MAKKKILHVNQHRIKQNAKEGTQVPIFTIKTYKSNNYGHQAVIRGKDGEEVARLVYRPDKPLSCGARVWIETYNCVDVIVDGGSPIEIC